MDEDEAKPVLPAKRRGHYVQTDRAAHQTWARLARKHPAATAMMHVLAANVGDQNAVVASHKVLAGLLDASVSTVKRALQTLVDGNWIEVHQIGANGTVNVYVLNSRVVWTEGRDRLRYSRLQAEVLLAEYEQPEDAFDPKPALHRLPRMDEFQIPSGPGLPPVSQPSLPGMDQDLPATGNTVAQGVHDG